MTRTPTTLGSVSALLVLALGAATGCSSDGGAGASGQESHHASSTPSAASTAQTKQAVDTLLAAGLKQVSGHQYDAATATFRTVLNLDAHNTYAFYNLGFIAQSRGDDATAITSYTDALAQDKDFSPALYNLAILTESSNLPGAVALYRREIVIKPNDAASYMRLGFALRHLGHQAEAQAMLAKGIALDPSMASVTAPAYS